MPRLESVGITAANLEEYGDRYAEFSGVRKTIRQQWEERTPGSEVIIAFYLVYDSAPTVVDLDDGSRGYIYCPNIPLQFSTIDYIEPRSNELEEEFFGRDHGDES